MITLFGANDVLRLVTSSAANIDIVATVMTGPSDNSSPAVKSGGKATIASAATTTLVTAPGAGNERTIFGLILRNRHASLACTLVLQAFDGTNAYEVYQVTLAAGEGAIYDGLQGWTYFNAQGMPKESQSQGSSAPAISEINQVVLAADVINNNSVANTMQDIAGLSFPVLAGGTYHFEFFIDYTSQATATGARFGLNGPAFSRLVLQGATASSSTANVYGNAINYNLPVGTATASPFTAGNVGYMTGFITPSVDGNVVARFASEIANSAIIAKRGSLLKWTRTL